MATGQSDTDWRALLASAGPYPLEAFAFVRDGLSHTVEQVHPVHGGLDGGLDGAEGGGVGGPSASQADVASPDETSGTSSADAGSPAGAEDGAEEAQASTGSGSMVGRMQSESRHVTGQQLCLGLRDYAIKRYGMMAPAVLRAWNLRRTDDFGRIVFAMIEHGLMSKTAEDTLDDFRAVYDFEEAFAQESLLRHVGRS
jgi:uncharacterized repeat protein (TIGR04138 family)